MENKHYVSEAEDKVLKSIPGMAPEQEKDLHIELEAREELKIRWMIKVIGAIAVIVLLILVFT